jgi:acyl-CoA reductase-like NAD-dependent aldehyde dehydrogenase
MSFATIESHNQEQWSSVADSAKSGIETRLFINGEYVDAIGGGRFTTINPANGESLAEMSDGMPWDRMEILYRFADLLEENAEGLAVLETLDMGKPIRDVVAEDMPGVVSTIRFMAEGIDKIEGSVTNTDHDALHLVIREPLGVVGCISPWNYPLLMAVWKIAPALAAGNTVVLKPGQSNMKRVALECGGKSPQIFMSDLQDMENAVGAAYNGVFANMGEVCSAGSRLLVERPIYDEFIERFVAEGQHAYKPGDPLDPATNMGPLIDRGSQHRVLKMIEQGRQEGATLHFGGDAPGEFERGAYVNPTLFGDVNNGMSRHDLWFGCRYLDPGHQPGHAAGQGHRSRRRLDQQLRRRRHDPALWRL